MTSPVPLGSAPTRVVLFVRRWEECLRFYAETLGLEPAYAPRRGWAEFRAGGTALCLQEGRVSDITTDEICKFGWQVPDLEAARRALLDRGVAVDPPVPFGGRRICNFYDPDDNALFLEGV